MITETADDRFWQFGEVRKRLLLYCSTVGNGSTTADRPSALNGGSTNHTSRLRSDDRCARGSGRPLRQAWGL